MKLGQVNGIAISKTSNKKGTFFFLVEKDKQHIQLCSELRSASLIQLACRNRELFKTFQHLPDSVPWKSFPISVGWNKDLGRVLSKSLWLQTTCCIHHYTQVLREKRHKKINSVYKSQHLLECCSLRAQNPFNFAFFTPGIFHFPECYHYYLNCPFDTVLLWTTTKQNARPLSVLFPSHIYGVLHVSHLLTKAVWWTSS